MRIHLFRVKQLFRLHFSFNTYLQKQDSNTSEGRFPKYIVFSYEQLDIVFGYVQLD